MEQNTKHDPKKAKKKFSPLEAIEECSVENSDEHYPSLTGNNKRYVYIIGCIVRVT